MYGICILYNKCNGIICQSYESIGGGIIIKPLVNSLGTMSVSIISFLSGCTVLTMCTVSLIRNRKDETKINMDITLYLAIGACIWRNFRKRII